MWQKNNGQCEAEKLKNQFTACLSTAIRRRRKEYILRYIKQKKLEILLDDYSGAH